MGSSYRGTLQGHENKPRLVQPPDAENRTSGGVGALTGETPVSHPIIVKLKQAWFPYSKQVSAYGALPQAEILSRLWRRKSVAKNKPKTIGWKPILRFTPF